MGDFRTLTIMAIIFLGFPVYFLPAYIAAKRELPNRKKILYWNLFTAWTLIGWVILIFTAARGSALENAAKEVQNESKE